MAEVSIIVPIYNLEQFLPKCIDSILEQTFRDIEIILVDDGSTDTSGKLCDEYEKADERIKVIHQKNMGLSGARNTGIKNATSKWFTIIDADDWYEPNAISSLYNNAETCNSDIFIASFFANCGSKEWKDSFFNIGEFHYSSKSEKTLLESSCINHGIISNYKCSTNVGVTWARLYRTDFVKNNNLNFIVGLRRTQDAVFNMYCFELSGKIDYIDLPVQHYRLWEESASKRFHVNFHETAIQIAAELYKFVSDKSDREVLQAAYNSKLVCLIIEIIMIELVHKKSQRSYGDKKKILKEVCKNSLFADAIKKAKTSNLTRGQGIAAQLLKLKLYDLILWIYIVKLKMDNF